MDLFVSFFHEFCLNFFDHFMFQVESIIIISCETMIWQKVEHRCKKITENFLKNLFLIRVFDIKILKKPPDGFININVLSSTLYYALRLIFIFIHRNFVART